MITLTPVMRKFILHWGEMGTRWGVNRTVAQVHALLYLSPEPLNAEAISKALSVARSNVSTSLRELESWGIIKAVQQAYGLRRLPSPARLAAIGESWRPYRSVACWYLWASLGNPPGQD